MPEREDSSEFFRRLVRCCACCGSMAASPHCNLVAISRRAAWKHPVVGNLLTAREGEAVAVVCDACLEAEREIRWAVEIEGERVAYHRVQDLARMPPEPTYRLVQLLERGLPPDRVLYPQTAIECLLCGRVSYNANDVRNRYCGRCHTFHERAEAGA